MSMLDYTCFLFDTDKSAKAHEGVQAMLDIKFVRENQEAVAEAMKNRHAT